MAFKKGKITGYQLHLPIGDNHDLNKGEQVPVYHVPASVHSIILYVTLHATNSEICRYKGISNSTYMSLRCGKLVASLSWWKSLKDKVKENTGKSIENEVACSHAQQSLPGL